MGRLAKKVKVAADGSYAKPITEKTTVAEVLELIEANMAPLEARGKASIKIALWAFGVSLLTFVFVVWRVG